MFEGQSMRFLCYWWVVTGCQDIFMRGVVPICLSFSAKASWFSSSSLSESCLVCLSTAASSKLGFCSAHSCVGDLSHLSVQGRNPSLEVCSLQVYLTLGSLWGHSIGFPLLGLGQICHPPLLRVMSHSPLLAIKFPFTALILTLLGNNSVLYLGCRLLWQS